MHKDIIAAAANVYRVISPEGVTREITLVDSCHMGRNMQSTIAAFKAFGCEVQCINEMEDRGQGFINQNGHYFARSESYEIAIKSGQPFNKEYTLPRNKLDSSCIRHFKSDKPMQFYMTHLEEL